MKWASKRDAERPEQTAWERRGDWSTGILLLLYPVWEMNLTFSELLAPAPWSGDACSWAVSLHCGALQETQNLRLLHPMNVLFPSLGEGTALRPQFCCPKKTDFSHIDRMNCVSDSSFLAFNLWRTWNWIFTMCSVGRVKAPPRCCLISPVLIAASAGSRFLGCRS